ncbi:MAG: NAD(P)-binding domain-containing protein [Candidatus Nanopelagicales bacterium]
MTSAARPHARIAVIGGGAAGITAMKELIERGVDAVGFEKGDRVGGLWVYENTSGVSPAYESLHLNTSKGRTEFADFPMPEEWEDYPSAVKVAGYLQDYADTFGVTERYLFDTAIESVDRTEDGWLLTTDQGEEFDFDGVIVANGHNWDPRWPEPGYPGTFVGTQMHAHDYRKAETFRGKRVLVVGMGNSAMDIAVDASYVADDVMLSARHGSFIVPKYLFGKPADATNGALSVLPWRVRQVIAQRMLSLAIGTPESYGLPKPSFGLFQNHPTISDTILHRITHGEVRPMPGIERFDGERVIFTDGSVHDVDIIVWATGYRVTIPFLDEEWLGTDPEAMPLYHRVFHTEDPSLTFVGLMQSTGAALPVVEVQSKLAAAYYAGQYALPTTTMQKSAIRRAHRSAVERWGQKRPMMRIDFDAFISDSARELRFGRYRMERGKKIFAPTRRSDGSVTSARSRVRLSA